jgi:hypothetical protein
MDRVKLDLLAQIAPVVEMMRMRVKCQPNKNIH